MTREEAISTLNSIKQYYNDKNEDSYVGFDNEDNEALQMAIKALEQEPCEDAISRQAVIYYIKAHIHEIITESGIDKNEHTNRVLRAIINGVETMPSVNPQRWIPIKTRPLTEEEKEEYADLGYGEDSVNYMYDCPLPEDGEEVLITTRHGEVNADWFYRDDGCYFETYCDEGDVKAWMPLPQPYKSESEEE